MQEEVLLDSNVSAEAGPPLRGRVVRGKWLYRLMTFLVVFGPGLIVMEADTRMSWVVVTDNDGKRQPRIQWERAREN
jgi:hypothetical protein